MTDAGGRTRVRDAGHVEQELAGLWRAMSSADHAVMRACMLNLVIYCEDGADLAAVSRDVARLSEQVPGRALVVCPEQDTDGDALDVFVSAHCHKAAGGNQVCSEQISFLPRGEGRALVPGTLRGLLAGDCPVVTWWRRPRLAGDPLLEPLAEMSERLVVDTRQVADPASFLGTLARVASTTDTVVGDVTWVRGEAWRDLVASLFDPATTRPWLERLTAVSVVGGGPTADRGVTVAAAYLAGWIATQLGWRPEGDDGSLWQRPDGAAARITCDAEPSAPAGEVVAVRLTGEHEGERACFEAHRTAHPSGLVRLAVEQQDACAVPYVRRLAVLDDLELFCGYLQRREGDSVFGDALAAAARIAGSTP